MTKCPHCKKEFSIELSEGVIWLSAVIFALAITYFIEHILWIN